MFEGLIQESDEADQTRVRGDHAAAGALGGARRSWRCASRPGRTPPGADLLAAEAYGLAAFLAGIARGGETVRDPVTRRLRPSRAGDVLVLARRLTRIQALEEALEAAGLRFTVEGGKSFFDRQEVHETLAVLRAIDDPDAIASRSWPRCARRSSA